MDHLDLKRTIMICPLNKIVVILDLRHPMLLVTELDKYEHEVETSKMKYNLLR